ncbi:hypothetical protein HYS54_03245 [Candidatus Micrarchaeota archaeon]|nr:hypothetical protein [Candidatus Micrarchaeota archaeon]
MAVDLIEAFKGHLESLGLNAVEGVKAAIIVLVFLAVGWIIAWAVARVVIEIFKRVKLEQAFKDRGIPFEVAGFSMTRVVALLLRVFIVLGFIGAGVANSGTGLQELRPIIMGFVFYVPHLIVGLIVLIAGLVLARYLADVVRRSEEVPAAHMAAIVVQVFVAYAAIVTALPEILPRVDVSILSDAFKWFVAAAGIAIGIGVGIAIGLGLKDQIARTASQHPGMFESIFGETERVVRKGVKPARRR